jgi:hypothetical protein
VKAANAELQRVLEPLDDATMSVVAFGDWNMKQLIAHVAGWQRLNAEMMQRMARGEHPIPEGEDYNDDDRMNAGFAAETEGKTAAEVIQSARGALDSFTRAAEALPEERFADNRFATKMLQGNGIDHVREHLAEIEVHLKGR